MFESQVGPKAEEEFDLVRESEVARMKSGKVSRDREKRRDEKRQEAIAEGELLEGPQLPDTAVSQDDIDSLFDSL